MFRAALCALLLAAGVVRAQTPSSLASQLLLAQGQSIPGDAMICVRVDGADPAVEMLTQLRVRDQRFVPASECVWVVAVDKGSFHRFSGAKAFFASVDGFRPSNGRSGEVHIEIRHHGRWRIFKVLEVLERHGAWEVVKVKRHEEA